MLEVVGKGAALDGRPPALKSLVTTSISVAHRGGAFATLAHKNKGIFVEPWGRCAAPPNYTPNFKPTVLMWISRHCLEGTVRPDGPSGVRCAQTAGTSTANAFSWHWSVSWQRGSASGLRGCSEGLRVLKWVHSARADLRTILGGAPPLRAALPRNRHSEFCVFLKHHDLSTYPTTLLQ